MGRLQVPKMEQQPVPRIVRRVTKPEAIPKVGHLDGRIVKPAHDGRARRDAYVGLGSYYLRSLGDSLTTTLDDPSLPHDLTIRSGIGLAYPQYFRFFPCQVICQSGELRNIMMGAYDNTLAGGSPDRRAFQVLAGTCSVPGSSPLSDDEGTLSENDFQKLCTDYHESHKAPPTELIEPSASVEESLAYISSELPSETYQAIVSRTEAHMRASSTVSVPVAASVFATSLDSSPTAPPQITAEDKPDPAIGLSVLGVGAGVALAIAGIVGTVKVLKSYLAHKDVPHKNYQMLKVVDNGS